MSEYKHEAECDYNEVLDRQQRMVEQQQEELQLAKTLLGYKQFASCTNMLKNVLSELAGMWHHYQEALEVIRKDEDDPKCNSNPEYIYQCKLQLLGMSKAIAEYDHYIYRIRLDINTLGLTNEIFTLDNDRQEFCKMYDHLNDLIHDISKVSKGLYWCTKSRYRSELYLMIRDHDQLYHYAKQCYEMIAKYKAK